MIGRIFASDRQDAVAVITDSPWSTVTYGQLAARVQAWRGVFLNLSRPALGWIQCENTLGCLCAYLAALAERVPVGLADAGSERSGDFVRSYGPSFVVQPAGRPIPAGYRLHWTSAEGEVVLLPETGAAYGLAPAPDLALLLTTSGSTGNARLVRLSTRNLQANASAIAEYLALGPGEISVQGLPLHYAYGLSLVNSHLWAGGTVALTGRSFLSEEFWGFFDRAKCTSFAGVPYAYETLRRLRWRPDRHPSLRVLTQAGGHLPPEIIREFHAATRASGRDFFVMYGQTEATARIAYVPPSRLEGKAGTIGIPLPRGQLELRGVDGGPLQELVYRGANVMLGYATGPQDLGLADSLHGVLRTGDLAEVDSDGFYRITGRLARFAKLFGRRIQLEDVESRVESLLGRRAAAVEGSGCVGVFVEGAAPDELVRAQAGLADFLALPPTAVRLVALAAIPCTAAGKKQYPALPPLC